jgi:hypothetical protein
VPLTGSPQLAWKGPRFSDAANWLPATRPTTKVSRPRS